MNTKTDGISSGLVAVAWLAPSNYEWPSHFFSMTEIRNGEPLVRLSDAEAIINDLQTLVIAENQRKQQLEAEVAAKDAEIMEQCRINGMGAERELALLGQIERQSAALKLAKDALQTLGQYYAWLNFGECRTYGEHVPIVDMRLADLICKEALAVIDALKGE